MKKALTASLFAGCAIALVIFVYFTMRILQGHADEPGGAKPEPLAMQRIVFISEDNGNTLWNAVRQGALQAANDKLAIEFMDSLAANSSDYLKNIDMAIAAKVDGIIVQGEDSPEFVQMVNKASQKGIPVITVVTDAPDSLRKTYVGPDHYREGLVLGEEIAKQLGGNGQVALVNGAVPGDYHKLRKKGVQEALAAYPQVQLLEVPLQAGDGQPATKETTELLNRYPECRTFLGLTGETVGGIVQTVKSRARLQDFAIYTFDESQEIKKWVEQGVISAALLQNPEEIGAKSVKLMLEWLEGKHNPLERNYYTPIEMVRRNGGA